MACPDVVDLFLRQAAEHASWPAVVVEGGTTTFAELEHRVRQFAALFASVPDARVMLALPAGADAYAVMLASGLAGGYYTPLNVAAPTDKLRRITELVRPDFIVAADEHLAALAAEAPQASALHPDRLPAIAPFAGRGTRHDWAYVIFTSGSTGLPKGVVIPRAALGHYVDWMTATPIIRAEDRVSQFANIAFDLSVFEIYGALCSGATLYPVRGQGDRLLPARMIRREGITVWTSVPSVLGLMMQAREATAANLRSVRLFNFCGEPLLRGHVEALFAACPGAAVQNTYGPTEATVSMTRLALTPSNYEAACGTSIALGDAIPGMGLHLVGGSHENEGEIVITGPQLAHGYWEDAEKTAHSFREVTLAGGNERGYFTGDWAERRGAHVFFKERLDFQIKIKGVRLELDEVAAAIRDCGWPVVCVVRWKDGLAAIVERSAGLHFDPGAIAAELALRIERAAIPDAIRLIDRMPRNENGKIDRKAAEAWLAESESVILPGDDATPR